MGFHITSYDYRKQSLKTKADRKQKKLWERALKSKKEQRNEQLGYVNSELNKLLKEQENNLKTKEQELKKQALQNGRKDLNYLEKSKLTALKAEHAKDYEELNKLLTAEIEALDAEITDIGNNQNFSSIMSTKPAESNLRASEIANMRQALKNDLEQYFTGKKASIEVKIPQKEMLNKHNTGVTVISVKVTVPKSGGQPKIYNVNIKSNEISSGAPMDPDNAAIMAKTAKAKGMESVSINSASPEACLMLMKAVMKEGIGIKNIDEVALAQGMDNSQRIQFDVLKSMHDEKNTKILKVPTEAVDGGVDYSKAEMQLAYAENLIKNGIQVDNIAEITNPIKEKEAPGVPAENADENVTNQYNTDKAQYDALQERVNEIHTGNQKLITNAPQAPKPPVHGSTLSA